jgi:poly-gamma-glutamate synthesis protein (capsule biosynthesis protein)
LQTLRPGEKSNYGRENLTFMALSGPVWLARGVGSRIEFHGAEYVIRDLANLFGQMDIAHISHGVPFVSSCPPEELEAIGDTTFCEPDRYVEIIQQLNVTVNDMTGNHVNDWGLGNLEHTLGLYEAAGIDTFGGGRSLEEAQTPWLFEHNSSKIALLGCNPVGPAKAWANSARGGAAPCDDYGWVGEKIQQLKAAGYLVVVVLQYEEFYHYHATAQQKADFTLLAALGADVVHGSQSHHPQTYGFEGAAVLHYGTGNTIGDQMYEPEVRESLIDVYVIQEGRVLGLWIWTGFIEDYCCNRPMSAEQRAELLAKLFAEMK